jgi:excisionase family DNA binding protein
VEGAVLWDPKMTARRLGVPVSWVYAKAAGGVLPSVKVGKYLRFRPEAIEAWLRSRTAKEGERR